MAAPRVYRADAVVLRHLRMGETDSILTLYTLQHGKLRAVAKGVAKPTSRMSGHLEPLTHCELLIARGRNLDIVTQAQTTESFQPIRHDLPRATAAIYAAELVDRFTEEDHESREIFNLLLGVLRWLAEAPTPELPLRWFEAQLLEASGFLPELQVCVECQEPLEARAHYFSPRAGGVLCSRCAGDGVRPLSLNALKVLRLLFRDDVEMLHRVRLEGPLQGEVEGVLRQYLTAILEREVRSAAFLDHVRAAKPTAKGPAASDVRP